MRLWHISDTHGHHEDITVPKCDIVIHSGDATNTRNKINNVAEFKLFTEWFESLRIDHKIYVAGNHDVSLEGDTFVDKKNLPFIYLENDSVLIEGFYIFGSPYTPSFGHGWAFNKNRSKLGNIWKNIIPRDTDILVTHGPPRGILDTTTSYDGKIENVGCSALMSYVLDIKPSLHLFGHIHDNDKVINHGTRVFAYKSDKHITFSNGAAVADRTYEITNHGNVFDLSIL